MRQYVFHKLNGGAAECKSNEFRRKMYQPSLNMEQTVPEKHMKKIDVLVLLDLEQIGFE